eukprot:scaffold2642_cov31-Prasinocladus_malaysianus.AAC.1
MSTCIAEQMLPGEYVVPNKFLPAVEQCLEVYALPINLEGLFDAYANDPMDQAKYAPDTVAYFRGILSEFISPDEITDGFLACVVEYFYKLAPWEYANHAITNICSESLGLDLPAGTSAFVMENANTVAGLMEMDRGDLLQSGVESFLLETGFSESVSELASCVISSVSEMMGPNNGETTAHLRLSGLTWDDWEGGAKQAFKRAVAQILLDDEEMFVYVNVAAHDYNYA